MWALFSAWLEPPAIDVALETRCPGVTASAPAPGVDLHRVTLVDPAAVCNDGSPAVVFVRAATDPAHADDWVVSLGSGGHCADPEDCAVRWCGEDFYDAGKMSSRWTTETAGAAGIHGRDPANAFAGWNQAAFHYCSSDRWTGSVGARAFRSAPDPFTLAFRGHDIVEAGLDALEAGAVSDDGTEALTTLTDARTVLFVGSSAGAIGAVQNVDRVAARLSSAEVLLVVDGWFLWAAPGALSPAHAVTVGVEARALALAEQATWAAVVDDDCVAAGGGWACSNSDHLLRHHVSTPFVEHHDLYDPVFARTYGDLGVPVAAYARAGAGTLGLHAAVPGASVLGSACGSHMALEQDAKFLTQTTEDAAGTPWTLHDIIGSALTGVPVVAVDAPSAAGSACP